MIIRKARVDDARGIAKVHLDTWKSAYRGIVPDDYLASLSSQKLERGWTKALQQVSPPEVVFVVDDPEEGIIGFARAGPCKSDPYHYAAELQAIYILEKHQRKGLGTQLFFQVTRHFLQHKINSMVLWVLTENSATLFYEELGGTAIAQNQREIGGENLPITAYAWPRLADVIPRPDNS